MFIKNLALKNFRNYEDFSVDINSQTVWIIGKNAKGKTNLLEAAYISGTTKSHKGSKDREMICFGKEEAHIQTNVKKKDASFRIDLHLKKYQSKGIAVNGIRIPRAAA